MPVLPVHAGHVAESGSLGPPQVRCASCAQRGRARKAVRACPAGAGGSGVVEVDHRNDPVTHGRPRGTGGRTEPGCAPCGPQGVAGSVGGRCYGIGPRCVCQQVFGDPAVLPRQRGDLVRELRARGPPRTPVEAVELDPAQVPQPAMRRQRVDLPDLALPATRTRRGTCGSESAGPSSGIGSG